MNAALKTVLSLSLSGSLMISILYLIRPLYKDRFCKCWQYYIWIAVIARLLLPIAPEANLMGSLFHEVEKSTEMTAVVFSPRQDAVYSPEIDVFPGSDTEVGGPAPTNPTSNPTPDVLAVALQNLWFFWVMVALILFIRKVTIYQSFLNYIRAGCVEVAEIGLLERFGTLVAQNRVNTRVELYTNSLISSPLLLGFFHPCIVLPSANLPPADFEYTIRHELTHFKRRDMFYKWLVQFTVCVHWFNPLVYLMGREINRACELSCDEAIIRGLDPHGRRAYGDTLLNAMGTGGNYENSLASVTLNESKGLLRERLDAIMNFKKQSKLIKFFLFITTLALCFGGLFTGVYAANADQMKENTAGTNSVSESAGDIVFRLTSNGQNAITKSGSFEAADGQILTLTIQSDLKEGSVDFFLFSPDYKEQRIKINGSDETKIITLKEGRWAYNCTGFFESGTITITGIVPQYSDFMDHLDQRETEGNEFTVLNLASNGQNSITQSGSFEANDNQTLTLTVESDIKGGAVDLFLFSPDNREQRITFSGSDETKTVTLSAGKWNYNCTGFFESGDITIVGTKQNGGK